MGNTFKNKSELDKAIIAGAFGPPELKKDERLRYLGFFRERVVQAITFDQLKTLPGKKAIEKALNDKKAFELAVRSECRSEAMPLISLANKKGVSFTVVNNPKFIGEVAIVVVAKEAVDVPKVMAEDE